MVPVINSNEEGVWTKLSHFAVQKTIDGLEREVSKKIKKIKSVLLLEEVL